MKRASTPIPGTAALSRGLGVLRDVAEHGPTTLHEVHLRLKMPKATAFRALHALEETGFLTRRLVDDAYAIGAEARGLFAALGPTSSLAGAAAPVLLDLAAQVPWPVDVATLQQNGLTVVDSNRRQLKWPYTARVLGYRPNMCWSAMGRAYIAYAPDAERRLLLAGIRKAEGSRARHVPDDEAMEALLRDIRARGYARRDIHHYTLDAESAEPLDAIALPLVSGSTLIGSMNCVWFAKELSEAQFVERYFDALQTAASEMAARVCLAPIR